MSAGERERQRSINNWLSDKSAGWVCICVANGDSKSKFLAGETTSNIMIFSEIKTNFTIA